MVEKNIYQRKYSTHSISNFKAFKDLDGIEIAPITLIYGQNSGGKSTFIQSILALSQSCDSISKAGINFSGNLVNVGTFQTIQNKPSKKDEEIIFESKVKSFINKRKGEFYIDAFDPIRNAKIKYFISDSRDPSKGLIQRLEISFDGFLKDLPLIFELNKRYRGEFSKQENSIFSLQKGSYENLAKITQKIYQKIILSLNNACSLAEDKSNIQISLDLGIRDDHFEFSDKSYEKKDPLFRQIINIVRYAAMSIGGWVEIKDSKVIFFALENLKKNKKYISLIKVFSEQFMDIFSKELIRKKFYVECCLKKKEDFIIQNKKNPSESETINIDDVEIAFKLFSFNSEVRFFEFRKDLLNRILDIQHQNRKKKFKVPIERYHIELDKFWKICLKLQKIDEEFVSSFVTELKEKDKNGATIQLTIKDELIKDIDKYAKKLEVIKHDLDSILYEMKIEIYYGISSRIDSLFSISFRACKVLKEKLSELDEKDLDDKTGDLKGYMSILDMGQHLSIFSNAACLIHSLYNSVLNDLFINNLFKLKNEVFNEEYFINQSLLFLLAVNKEDFFSPYFYNLAIRSTDNFSENLYDKTFTHEIIKKRVSENYPGNNFLASELADRGKVYKNYCKFLPFPLYDKVSIPQEFSQEVIHLGPARPGAKRFYTSQEVDNLMPNDTAYILKYDADLERRMIYVLNRICNSINFLDEIRISPIRDRSLDAKKIEVKTSGSDTFVNIADTGYGVSQLLPIIYNSISEKNQTILVQQPETHLHPRLQAEVGTLMAESVDAYRKNWIVETHSEIILLRLLKLIRTGKLKSEFLRVYYVDKSNKGGSFIKRMHVSDNGELITQWPKGFFSNEMDEIFDL